MQLTPEQEQAKAWLDARPGSVGTPTGHKVMGKTFAILSIRRRDGMGWLIQKCDPHLAEVLREQYPDVGHRSHLYPRHWIAITLGAGVPPDEIERLIGHSYDLVCAGLTKKQRAELAALEVAAAKSPPPKPPKTAREAKLAEALRANLKRRKAAQRGKSEAKKN